MVEITFITKISKGYFTLPNVVYGMFYRLEETLFFSQGYVLEQCSVIVLETYFIFNNVVLYTFIFFLLYDFSMWFSTFLSISTDQEMLFDLRRNMDD